MPAIANRKGRAIRNRLPSRETRDACLALETEAFNKSIAAFLGRVKHELVGVAVRRTAIDLTARVTKRTPQKEGRAAAGWLPFARDHGGRTFGVSGPGVTQGMSESSYSANLRGTRPYVEMTNAVPHIMSLEVGAAPHDIVAKKGKALAIPLPANAPASLVAEAIGIVGTRRTVYFRRKIRHPGNRSYRMLKRSMREIRRHVEANFVGLVRP